MNPLITEYKFHLPEDDQIEIPLVYTMRQIEMAFGQRFQLVAKIMSTNAGDEDREPVESKIKFYKYIKEKTRFVKTKDFSAQISPNKINSDVKRIRHEELFSVGGYKKPKITEGKYDFLGLSKYKKEEILKKLLEMKKHKILRGVNFVGYCRNKNCHNYQKWIVASLGFGKYRFNTIHSKIICEICPRKDMLPKNLVLKVIFFKNCKFRILDNRVIYLKDKEKFDDFSEVIGNETKVKGIKSYMVEESRIWEYKGKDIILEITGFNGLSWNNDYWDKRDLRIDDHDENVKGGKFGGGELAKEATGMKSYVI